MNVKLSHLSIFFSAAFFPFALLVGSFVELYFKGVNPEDRDITQGLAYLGYILIPTFIVLAAGWLAALFTALAAKRTEGDATAQFAFKLFMVMTVAVVVLGVTNKLNSKIEDNYKDSHNTQSQ